MFGRNKKKTKIIVLIIRKIDKNKAKSDKCLFLLFNHGMHKTFFK